MTNYETGESETIWKGTGRRQPRIRKLKNKKLIRNMRLIKKSRLRIEIEVNETEANDTQFER